MAEYTFERESRTPFSEAYVVREASADVGRVDIHFSNSGIVYATLCVLQSLDEDGIEELIAEVDERLVLTADPTRDDLVVTVWRGSRAGVYSEETEDDASQDDASQDDASQDDASQDDASQDDASQDDASQDDASQDDASQDDASQDDASQDDASQDDAPQDDAPEDTNGSSPRT